MNIEKIIRAYHKARTSVVVIGLGVLLVALTTSTDNQTWSAVGLGIGCSLIASGGSSFLNFLVFDDISKNPLEEWHIEKIYEKRSQKSAESDPELDKAKYQVDVVAFGLSSFRDKNKERVETCLRNGVNFRILTMAPDSKKMKVREEEENNKNIKNSILQLVDWAKELNQKGYNGNIQIKVYNCMTLDFYWRVDNELYVGPYWYGHDSQQTITFKFSANGKGFEQYTSYFEELWKDPKISKQLV